MLAETQPSNPKSQPSKLGYGDYLRFRNLVLERSGLHFPERKWADLEIGLFKALAASPLAQNGSYNLDHYYNLLCDKSSPAGQAEMDRLIKALTIGETHFFRDQAQFDALATQVLPALIARKRAAAASAGFGIQPHLRVWSAGCATGEEAYSLAILLKELLPDLEQWRILILATDINPDSLARAKEALYSDWSFRETRAKALRPHYFNREASTGAAVRYRLSEDIRQMVTFATLNLIEDDYPAITNNTGSMDLIICRNVTIYFTEDTTRQVVHHFYQALTDGGWLVVGHSEPSLVVYRAFQAHTFAEALLYQKTGQPTAWPADWELLDKNRTDKKWESWPYPLPHPQQKGLPQPILKSGGEESPWRKTRSFRRTSPLACQPHPNLPPTGLATTSDPYELARMLLDQGRPQEAIAALQQKVSAEPDFAPAHSLLGLTYANLGRWPEARQWCQSALKLNNLLAESYFVLGLVHQHENEFAAAIAMLKKAIYIDRNAPLFHFNLGMLYRRQGQSEMARRAYHNVVRILEKWPPDTAIPDAGGTTAGHLLDTIRRMIET